MFAVGANHHLKEQIATGTSIISFPFTAPLAANLLQEDLIPPSIPLEPVTSLRSVTLP